MRTATVLVILGCFVALSLASYASKKTPAFQFDANIVQKNERPEQKASFSDLLTLFQTHDFNDNTPILNFLETLRKRIHDEHSEHSALHTTQVQECKDEEDFRNAEIQAGTDAEAAASSYRDTCVSERDEATALRDLADSALVIYNGQLDELRAERQRQIALFNERSRKLNDAHDAINKALEFLDELELEAGKLTLQQSVALVQLVNTLLAVSVQTKQTNQVLPIYNKLIQTHAKQSFNINDIEEVRGLIESIRSNVESSLNALAAQDAADAETFVAREAELLALIDKLNTQLTLSNDYIDKMEACITQETSIAAMAHDKIIRNQELLAQAQKMCADGETEWTEAEKARRNQLELIDQLQWAIEQLSADFQAELVEGYDIGTVIPGAPKGLPA